MRIRPLSKDASQVNFSNSILKHFNAETFHDSYKPLDEILERNKGRKIVLFLFDGFGKQIQEATKDCCPFIYSHGLLDLNTVYPPTTVAATTAVLSGKYPVEAVKMMKKIAQRADEYFNSTNYLEKKEYN